MPIRLGAIRTLCMYNIVTDAYYIGIYIHDSR